MKTRELARMVTAFGDDAAWFAMVYGGTDEEYSASKRAQAQHMWALAESILAQDGVGPGDIDRWMDDGGAR